MPKTFSAIQVIHLNTGSSFAHPQTPPEIVHLDDPALHVMTDLKHANAITIEPDATISEAAMEMRVCHTHLLLVVDNENIVRGLISSEDILGEKPLKITQEKRMRRAEVLVHMVMTPQEEIVAINNEDLNLAKVGNVVKTLHELKQHYALAVEVEQFSGEQTVCGLFSLSQISKQLGFDVTSDISEAQSIIELHRDVKG